MSKADLLLTNEQREIGKLIIMQLRRGETVRETIARMIKSGTLVAEPHTDYYHSIWEVLVED